MFTTMVVLPPKPRALPTLIVALHRTCPCPRVCAADLNRLARELAPVARVVGVVDADRAGTLQEAKESGLTFAMRSDPKGLLLSRLGASYTLDLALVGPDGKRLGFWGGFDRTAVVGILALVKRPGSSTSIDASTYPEVAQTGCRLNPAKVTG